MRIQILLPCLLLFVSCGDLGPTPTERVLASQNNDNTVQVYQDPYTDGTRLEKELALQKDACEKANTSLLGIGLDPKIKLSKEEKESIASLKELLSTACYTTKEDLSAFFEIFGKVAVSALTMANEFRGSSISVDLLTGEVDPVKEKQEKVMTQYANTFESIGQMVLDQIQVYLLYAPLETRKKAAESLALFYRRLPPDYEKEVANKRFGTAWSLEGDALLKDTLCGEIYGRAKCDALKTGTALP